MSIYIISEGGVEIWGTIFAAASFEATIWIANPSGAMCKRIGIRLKCFANFYGGTCQ